MDLLRFLDAQTRPATGCTEPIAVGYATALAYYAIFNSKITITTINGLPKVRFSSPPPPEALQQIQEIQIETDRNVYKNSYAIMIPGTNGQKGMKMAACLALFANPDEELNIFGNISSNSIQQAIKILPSLKISTHESEDLGDNPRLDIHVKIRYLDAITNTEIIGKCRLQDDHTHITYISHNDNQLYEAPPLFAQEGHLMDFPRTIEQIVATAQNLPKKIQERLLDGLKMNQQIAQEGLLGQYGLGVGKSLSSFREYQLITNNGIVKAKIYAAAASDARMGGAPFQVMTTSGSGNQGIIATLPLGIIAEINHISNERLAESLLISHMITYLAEIHTGHLSALCGADIKSGMGLTAAIIYLLGGSVEEMHAAINLMAANITGVVCDGAKEGCALKVYKSVGTAIESAMMALGGVRVPNDNGIIFGNAEKTLEAIGSISHSMGVVDKKILELMRQK